MSKRCDKCEHYFSKGESYIGQCRLDPPVLVQFVETNFEFLFPEVFRDDWCGKYTFRFDE